MYWNIVFILGFGLVDGLTRPALLSTRIIGGSNLDIDSAAYQVSLRKFNSHFCGGSIIGNRHILTAAHCILDDSIQPFENITIHTGTSLLSEAGNVHHVAKYKTHPRYIGTEEASWINDIAVIELVEYIEFDAKQKPIKLPTHKPKNGTTATLTGWGFTDTGTRAEHLQMLETRIITTKHCQPLEVNRVYKSQVCAFNNNETGACYGDSGGPLAVNDEIVGITSWSEGDLCANGYPDVFTNVFSYLKFIERNTK